MLIFYRVPVQYCTRTVYTVYWYTVLVHKSLCTGYTGYSIYRVQQNLFYLRSGFVFAALAVCHHYARLCLSASILLYEQSRRCNHVPRSSLTPTQWLYVVTTSYAQTNTHPMSLEDYQKILFYLRSGSVLVLSITSCHFGLLMC